jgi:hypothetical protein
VRWVHSYAVIMAMVTVLISFYQYCRHFFTFTPCPICAPTFNKTHHIDFSNERDLILSTDYIIKILLVTVLYSIFTLDFAYTVLFTINSLAIRLDVC